MWHNKNSIKCLIIGCILFLLTGCTKGNDASKQYEEGLFLLNEGNCKEAIVSLQEAINNDADGKKLRKSEQILNKKASYALGVAYYREQNYKIAEKYLEEALAISYLDEWDEEIKNYQVDTLCALDKYEKAYDIIVSLREKRKNDFSLFFREYFILDALDKDQEKETLLNEGLLMKGHGSEYKFNQGKIHYFLGDRKEAKEAMEEALENKIEEANFYLGRIYEDNEFYKKAIFYYNTYKSSLDTENDFVNLRIAACYEKSDDYESALNVYKSAIKSSDGSFLRELRYNQIVALEEDAQFEEAFKKCSAYRKDYKEDDSMKKEFEYLETRVQYEE